MTTRRRPSAVAPAALGLALLVAACGLSSPRAGPPDVDLSHVAAADPGSSLPASWRLGPFMEIYVRGYQDSDGDGMGDLQGLTARLDYLQALGVTGLWLMPVTASQDHDHGYAVTDYRALEQAYGTQADLAALLAAAHARGMGVILDYVMNHSAAQNPLFEASAGDAPGGWRDWYVWASGHPRGWSVFGGDPWHEYGGSAYYAAFWDQMPDFNLKNPEVVTYHQDNLRLWLNRGVDGFRFDAIGELVENGPAAWQDQDESYALMADVRTLVGGYAGRYLVCEDPDGTATPDQTRATDACGAAFDFGLRPQLVRAAGGDPAALSTVAGWFDGRTPEAALRRATILANHDAFTGGRVLDQLGQDEARARVAAALLLLLPGTPFLYYGEEIGMTGATSLSGDWKIRTPMSWSAGAGAGFSTGTPFRALAGNAATHHVAAEQADPGSLLAWYRQLIALRQAVPALAGGSYEAPEVQGSALAFRRTSGASHALVLVNVGTAAAQATASGLPAGAALTGRFPSGTGDAVVAGDGTLAVAVPALAPLVYTW